MSKTKNIVILGCPRSGTSLVANLIRSAGYDIDNNGSKRLMKPNPQYNPDGYFERLDIVKLNDRLIKEIDPSYSFLNPPQLYQIKNHYESNDCDLAEINEELSKNKGWSIKDSRLSFTFQYYKNLQNVHIIKVVRNPYEVQRSMINHYGDLFTHDITHGPHFVRQIDFELYYTNINECIDWQKLKYPNIQISYDDILQFNLAQLESFIDSRVDQSLINEQHRKFKV